MKILVLGATGMLGFAVHRVFVDAGFETEGAIRAAALPASSWCSGLSYRLNVDAENFSSVAQAISDTRADVVINAMGVLRHDGTEASIRRMLAVNSHFPRLLDQASASLGIRLVHFSSDGVFSGRRGNYDERSPPDAVDCYGLSKFLGEPVGPHCLTLRTSVIGRALSGSDTLVDWFLSQSGAVRGFRRAIYSGLPAPEIARVLAQLILPRREPLGGVFHLSSAPITKYELLNLVRAAWGRQDLQVEPDDGVSLDRSLDSTALRKLIGYDPKPWRELVADMHSFYGRFAQA